MLRTEFEVSTHSIHTLPLERDPSLSLLLLYKRVTSETNDIEGYHGSWGRLVTPDHVMCLGASSATLVNHRTAMEIRRQRDFKFLVAFI